MLGNEKVQKRPFEPCAHAAVQPMAAAREFDAPFVIDKAERGAKIHVVFRLETEFGLFAVHLHHTVVFLFSRNEVVVGQIREHGDKVEYLLFERGDLFVRAFYLAAERAHLREDLRNVLSLFFQFGYFSGDLVPLRFHSLYVRNAGAAFAVPCLYVFEIDVAALFRQRLFHFFGVAQYPLYIQHRSSFLLS